MRIAAHDEDANLTGPARSATGAAALVSELLRTHRIVIERVDAVLRPFELTFARFEILRLLTFTAGGHLTIGALGDLLQVNRPESFGRLCQAASGSSSAVVGVAWCCSNSTGGR